MTKEACHYIGVDKTGTLFSVSSDLIGRVVITDIVRTLLRIIPQRFVYLFYTETGYYKALYYLHHDIMSNDYVKCYRVLTRSTPQADSTVVRNSRSARRYPPPIHALVFHIYPYTYLYILYNTLSVPLYSGFPAWFCLSLSSCLTVPKPRYILIMSCKLKNALDAKRLNQYQSSSPSGMVDMMVGAKNVEGPIIVLIERNHVLSVVSLLEQILYAVGNASARRHRSARKKRRGRKLRLEG